MKEQVTIRLYQHPDQAARCDGQQYTPAEDVRGWDFQRGDQIGLHERQGGYLMGVIDHLQPETHEDETGSFKLAELWTQD